VPVRPSERRRPRGPGRRHARLLPRTRAGSGAFPGDPWQGTADVEQRLAELDDDDLPQGARPVFLLEGKSRGSGSSRTLFKTALAAVRERAPTVHAQRADEVLYLTNVLVSGCAVDGRAFRPFEAMVAVTATCNLGLEHLVKGPRARDAREKRTLAERALDWLIREGGDKIFRVGGWLLHHEVGLATCDALAGMFTALARSTADAGLRRSYERAAQFVDEKKAQGKPTFARDALLDLPVDEPTRAVLEGLLSECPLLVGPLARDGARGYPLDRERQFVATRADLKRVRAFLAALEAATLRE
jgi:hypothetical protein